MPRRQRRRVGRSVDLFTKRDLEKLLVFFADDERDDDFFDTFMSTIAIGRYGSNTIIDKNKARAVPFLFSIDITAWSFTGVPKTLEIPESATTTHYVKHLKLPIGAVQKLYDDKTFLNQFIYHLYAKHKRAMLQRQYCPGLCLSCGEPATGFKTQFNLKGGTINVNAGEGVEITGNAYPVCLDSVCNKQLAKLNKHVSPVNTDDGQTKKSTKYCAFCFKSKRDVQEESNGEQSLFSCPGGCKMVQYCSRECQERHADMHQEFCRPASVESCSHCGKLKPDVLRDEGRGLMVCAKCQMVHYCNKECQKAHWREHKQMCQQVTAARG